MSLLYNQATKDFKLNEPFSDSPIDKEDADETSALSNQVSVFLWILLDFGSFVSQDSPVVARI